MVALPLYLVLALGELLLLSLVGGIWAWIALRRLRRQPPATVAAVEDPAPATASAAAAEPEAGSDYPGQLRQELEQVARLLGVEDGQPELEDDDLRKALRLRRDFLGLELEWAEAAGDDARDRALVAGMQGLLANNPWPPAEAAEPAPAAEVPDHHLDRETVLEQQLSNLQAVIDNQHQAMRELRSLLEQAVPESEARQQALAHLETAEQQGEALARQAARLTEQVTPGADRAEAAGEEGSLAEDLHHLVGNQQQEIDRLWSLVQAAFPDSEPPPALAEAVEQMGRVNRELGGCVQVLEQENERLRGEVDSLRRQIDDLNADG